MISEDYSLKDFIETIKDRDYLDIIYLADREATEAERRSFRHRKAALALSQASLRYADLLKGFIYFLRYGVRPNGLSNGEFHLFCSVCDGLLKRRSSQVRCYDHA